LEPNLYGDTTWYRGVVVGKSLNAQGAVLKVNVTGSNQLNITTTKGTAEVFLPMEQKKRSPTGLPSTRWKSQAGPKEVMGKGLVHELFEAQVKKTPNSIALSCEHEGLTYGVLNQGANRLAAYLRSLGIGPEVSIGILMESSLDGIMAMLAILKAGGAYIFLDPDYPVQRLVFMLKDAQVRVLLTQERFKTHLPDYTQTMVCLDSDKECFATRSSQNPDSLGSSENLAYFMYTSGSTNEPKKVGVAHASLYLYINSLKKSFKVVPGDIYLQTASFAFSASTRQIFLPLCVGASLHLATAEQRKDSVLLYELISRKQITVWDTVPSAWRNCVETVFGCKRSHKALPIDNALRLILLTGEALDMKTIQKWKAHLTDSITILNLYSQTESVGTISYFPLSHEWDNTHEVAPLGRPLKGTTVHLLDNQFHPVEADEVGSICVGGERMARGYLNRPDLTAERFIPDASGDFPGGRVHNTGDLARYHLDESIEWMGRRDQQVKLRGYRVELGEIKAELSQHPEVEAVVVLCREDIPGEKQLVAYITTDQKGVKVADLRAYLRVRLPGYMVPGAFVILEQLPLTPNGKVDKQALPAPESPDRTQDMIYVTPRNVIENLLVKIWQEVLKVEGIGIHDNFFELGGHSLLATQAVARLRDVLELDLPLRTLFGHPTVAQLASVIDTQLSKTFPDWPTDESENLHNHES
jgi:amino acid adenylation domain-containing protein